MVAGVLKANLASYHMGDARHLISLVDFFEKISLLLQLCRAAEHVHTYRAILFAEITPDFFFFGQQIDEIPPGTSSEMDFTHGARLVP